MDLLDLTPKSNTVEVNLVHPNTGDPLLNDDGSSMWVEVYAMHSPEYKKINHAKINERLNRKSKEVDYADIEEATIEILASVTKAWNITYKKECPKPTLKNAREVYEKVFWIREQIDHALNNSLDFTKG